MNAGDRGPQVMRPLRSPITAAALPSTAMPRLESGTTEISASSLRLNYTIEMRVVTATALREDAARRSSPSSLHNVVQTPTQLLALLLQSRARPCWRLGVLDGVQQDALTHRFSDLLDNILNNCK